MLKRFFQLFSGNANLQNPEAEEAKALSPEDAHHRVSQGALIGIDVRRPDEWAQTGRPAGFFGVTLQDPEFLAKVLAIVDQNRRAAIAVSCKTGPRAAAAADALIGDAFEDVSSVTGGFEGWKKAGLPIDRD